MGGELFDKRRNAERDWKDDAGGGVTMKFSQFFDAIFELADIWCETTDINEYIMFLDILFQKVYLDATLPKILRKHINYAYIKQIHLLPGMEFKKKVKEEGKESPVKKAAESKQNETSKIKMH